MLVFVVPLKSAKVSKSWDTVCQLFERTLRSVCQQTSSQFHVIVVCNEKPEIKFQHPQVSYMQVDLPIPGEDYLSKEKDKMCKMLLGMNEARRLNPSHIMFVDADDCVSKNLAAFVEKNNHENGWFISQGYEYRADINQLKVRKKNLHLRTNTSHIIRIDLLEPDMDTQFDEVRRKDFILNHIDTANILKSRGTPLAKLPFPGMVYITDNGENMWWDQSQISTRKDFTWTERLKLFLGKSYQKLITRPLTSAIQDEFYLHKTKVA